jgi:hypothetical protein
MTDRYDFILEAAHLNQTGQIEFFRVYERRDSSYSDRVIFSRPMLVEALQKNKKAAIGRRIRGQASTFEIIAPVYLSDASGTCLTTSLEQSSPQGDTLPGLPYI